MQTTIIRQNPIGTRRLVKFPTGRLRYALIASMRLGVRSIHTGLIQSIKPSSGVGSKQVVDASDRQSPVTDGKGHPLGGTAAAIATGKHSRQTRFECLRQPLALPTC